MGPEYRRQTSRWWQGPRPPWKGILGLCLDEKGIPGLTGVGGTSILSCGSGVSLSLSKSCPREDPERKVQTPASDGEETEVQGTHLSTQLLLDTDAVLTEDCRALECSFHWRIDD